MENLLINQIALRVPDQSVAMSNILNSFNVATKFDLDSLKMDGVFNGRIVKDVQLDLSFNFEIIKGFEFELITSSSNYHWHNKIIERSGSEFFLSHLGCYCSQEKMEEVHEHMINENIKLIQETVSREHSSIRSDGSLRCYKDLIFESEEFLGFRLKLSTHGIFNEDP